MGLFGKMDAETIPSNPFFVEKGTYAAEVTDAKYKDVATGRQLHIQYTINEEASQYDKHKVPQFFFLVDAELTQEQLEMLPSEEQTKIRRNISALKRTLCGNEGNDFQKGLGVNPDDLNDENWNPATLIGTKVNIGVNNYGPGGQKVAVKWVNIISE